MKIFNKITIFLILTCICSCSGFQAHKVKLKDFPEIEKGELNKKISISHSLDDHSPIHQISEIYEVKRFSSKNNNTKCFYYGYVNTYNKLTTCPFITNYIAPFTLFIIPSYCATHYEAHASLHTQDETQNNINNQQNNQNENELSQLNQVNPHNDGGENNNQIQTQNQKPRKLGNHQNSNQTQNNQKYKTLKTYKLEDRVDEVWSFFYVLLLPIWEPKSPEYAKSQTYTRISEAITRQVLNDAKNFKECYKNEEDYYKYQKEKEEIENKGTSH